MTILRSAIVATLAFAITACRSAPAATAPAPSPAPAPAPEADVVAEAPINWQLLDPATDHVPGISLLRAERELLAGKQPQRTIVVAVIDNGVDTSHAQLRPHLWVNVRETGGNGADDDHNGYADDVRGWNLIGGRDGRNVDHDTFEITRLARMCSDTANRAAVPLPYRDQCPTLLAEFSRRRGEAEQTLATVRRIESIYRTIMPYLRGALKGDSLTVDNVTKLETSNDTVRNAKRVYLQLASQQITPDVVKEAKDAYESQVRYGFDSSFNPRAIVGDDYPDTLVKRYGNPDVTGPGPLLGTHVAGIIGGTPNRVTDSTVEGIAQSVRIMAVRVVPDGDERDKDVANGIRYAVDNGAQIINMSFGKSQSPYKALVDAAVRYADSKGVLMVHASGNDANDIDTNNNFPNATYLDGGHAQNWIEVGSSSWKGADSLVAPGSNWGHRNVDVFAPGADIYSTVPGGYKRESGTSMASPMVAGLAALIMSYYPKLTAADVKRVILESSTKYLDQMVFVGPQSDNPTQVRFGDASVSGGVINAYAALRLAAEVSEQK